MKKKILATLALVLVAFSFQGVLAQETVRPVKTKVAPEYPALAKKMNLTGVVKLEVTIDSSGTVRTVRSVGGHPILIEAATKAIKIWKFEPGPESSEVIQFRFSTQ